MKDYIREVTVNGIVAVALCAALLISVCVGQMDMSQSLAIGLLGFLSKSAIK